jgi:hypothetical protein
LGIGRTTRSGFFLGGLPALILHLAAVETYGSMLIANWSQEQGAAGLAARLAGQRAGNRWPSEWPQTHQTAPSFHGVWGHFRARLSRQSFLLKAHYVVA